MKRRKLATICTLATLILCMVASPLSASVSTQDMNTLPMEDILTELMYDNSGITIIEGTFSYSGAPNALGTFTGGEDVFGIGEGIVLSTGDITSIIGPNISGSTSFENGTPGDADLTALVGQSTNDASVIEFDFIPENDFVSFQYVFGSEEYLEYVGSAFNDVFAFFVNGTNYALLPNDDVVSINNVNTLVNSEYYVDNDPRISPDAALDTEMDGFTTVLTFLAPVNSGVTNHLKIAVGDTFDSKYDSTVLIKAGSLTGRKSDLSLEKTVSNETPGAQETVGYTLTVTNAGPDDATGVVVEDVLPEGTMYAGYQGDGTYSATTGLWNVPTVPSGGSAAITLYAIVRQSGAKTNTAEIVESDNYDPDSTPGNGVVTEDDMASVNITPLIADLSLEKDVDVQSCSIGDDVSFTLTVTNDGPDDATGVTVKDNIPAALTVLSSSGDGTYNAATNIWTVPTIPSGESATMILTTHITAGGMIVNSAEVWSSACFDNDSTPGNGVETEDDYDAAAVNPTVVDVSLSISIDEQRPGVGEESSLSVTVTNDGPDDASGLSTSVYIPSGLLLVTSSGGAYNATTGIWDIGSLSAGESTSLDMTVRAINISESTVIAEVETMLQADIDSTPGNGNTFEDDYDMVRITPLYSDLFIVSAASDAHPAVGDEVTITVTVANDGRDPTGNVSLSNILAPGLEYVSHEGIGTYNPATNIWIVGDLATAGSATIALKATVAVEETMTCTAEVLTSDNYDPDSTPGNGNTVEDDYSIVILSPTTDNEKKEVENPYNHFAILMPVVVTNMGDANAVWGCIMDELPEDVPEELAALMEEVSVHMENATTFTNTIYVNSELEKALACLREASQLLECGCWEQYCPY